MDAGKLLDAAVEAEKVLLGGLLVNAEHFDEAAELLSAADFFRASHGLIFEAMVKISSEGGAIDPFTVRHALTPRELTEVTEIYLFDLVSGMPRSGNTGAYAQLVRDYAIRRELEAHGHRVVSQTQSGEQSAEALLMEAEQTIDRLRGRAVRVEVQDSASRANDAFAQLELIANGKGLQGVSTGLRALDADLRGLHPGNLILLGARPSQGKSCLGMTMAMAAAASTNIPSLFISLEMSSQELNLRELTMRSQVDGWRLSHGKLRDVEYPRVVQALEDLRVGNVRLVENPSLTVGKIRVLARRARATSGVSLIVVDYLQLLDDGRSNQGDSRVLALGDISRGLKILARELNVPIVALSQLNRKADDRPDRAPRMSDLRESGSLEQDADVVLLLHRPWVSFPADYPPELAHIIIAKQRNGPTGIVEVDFIAEQTRFADRRAA